jgi:hypothetical protein
MSTEPQTHPDPLLTISEVADWMRRSEAQMRWLRHTGAGPRSAKVAGRVMYRTSDVERYIADAFDKDGPDAA